MMLGTFSLPNVNIADWKAVVELGCTRSTLAACVAVQCMHSAAIFLDMNIDNCTAPGTGWRLGQHMYSRYTRRDSVELQLQPVHVRTNYVSYNFCT